MNNQGIKINLNIFSLLIILVGFSNILICQNYDFEANIKTLKKLNGSNYIRLSLKICEQYSLSRNFEKTQEYCNKCINEANKIRRNKNTLSTILKDISKIYLNTRSTDISFYKESFEVAKESLKNSDYIPLIKQNIEILNALQFKVSDEILINKIRTEIIKYIEKYKLPKNLLKNRIVAPVVKLYQEPLKLDSNLKEITQANTELNREVKSQKSINKELTDSLNSVLMSIQKHQVVIDSLEKERIAILDSININQQRFKGLESRIELKEKQNNLLKIVTLLGLLLSAVMIFGMLHFRKLNRRLAEKTKIIAEEKMISEKALRREAESLRELKERETVFYTNITHEIRTPLTVINGMASKISENPEKWVDHGTRLIKRNTNEILNLVNALLDISKVDTGYITVSNIQTDIITYLSYLVESYTSFAESKGISLTTEIKTGRCIMDFDMDKIKTIIVNLVSNAIKYTKTNGNVVVRLEEINSDSNPKLRIDIIDDGIGIRKEDQEKLFDRYYQVNHESTKGKKGSGIGLSHSKSLADLIGAEIFVESELGKGSTFTIILPITNKAEFKKFQDISIENLDSSLIEETADVAMLKENLLSDEEKPTLLIIEDNEDVLFVLVSFLEGLYNVIVEKNGDEGINRAIKEIPDLILSDVMMPGKDGFEVCKTLKKHVLTCHIPIVLLTALNDHDNESKGIRVGADGYISKPPDEDKLILLINNRLRNRERVIGNHSEIMKQRDPNQGPNELFLQKLNDVIEKNLSNENFNREVLCSELDLKINQLHNKVKVVSGLSITNYIKTYRIARAKEMLSDPKGYDVQVQEIAWRVGIEPNYFVKVFKSIVDETPNEFRKSLFDR